MSERLNNPIIPHVVSIAYVSKKQIVTCGVCFVFPQSYLLPCVCCVCEQTQTSYHIVSVAYVSYAYAQVSKQAYYMAKETYYTHKRDLLILACLSYVFFVIQSYRMLCLLRM